jgi:RimJ/RimL family protein N-acetyltransferase
VEVREARPSDVPEVVALHASVAAEGRWIGAEAPVDVERVERMFSRAIEADGSQLLVAIEDGNVVGYLGLQPTTPGVLGLVMSVDPTFRGQGVGTELLSTALRWARGRATAHKVELEVWPHNAAGLALYAGAGFGVEGRRRRHYRRRSGELWDSILMGLVLDDASPDSPHPDHAR